ncbi:MAG: HalOD1 output domain-containing protein [Natrialbaceae archaeon]
MAGRSTADVHGGAGETIVTARHDPEDWSELSTSVLMALDEVPGYDVESADRVVFDSIDLEALDNLFRPVEGAERTGRVTFPIDGYEVTVTAAGEITITDGPATGV